MAIRERCQPFSGLPPSPRWCLWRGIVLYAGAVISSMTGLGRAIAFGTQSDRRRKNNPSFPPLTVIPAKVGIHWAENRADCAGQSHLVPARQGRQEALRLWIPAFAGKTGLNESKCDSPAVTGRVFLVFDAKLSSPFLSSPFMVSLSKGRTFVVRQAHHQRIHTDFAIVLRIGRAFSKFPPPGKGKRAGSPIASCCPIARPESTPSP